MSEKVKYYWFIGWTELNKKGNKEQLYFNSSTVFEHGLSNPLPLSLDEYKMFKEIKDEKF